MELLANIYDPRIPISVLMLQLGFKAVSSRAAAIAPAAVHIEIPVVGTENYEEPERWDGLS